MRKKRLPTQAVVGPHPCHAGVDHRAGDALCGRKGGGGAAAADAQKAAAEAKAAVAAGDACNI